MDNLGILIQAILSLKDTTDSKKQISKQIVINEKDSIYGSCNDLCSRLQKWRWRERG